MIMYYKIIIYLNKFIQDILQFSMIKYLYTAINFSPPFINSRIFINRIVDYLQMVF